MGKYLYNALRVVMSVLCVAGLLAGIEISLFKEHASPLHWGHIGIAVAVVGVILACMWDAKNPPRNDRR
ncbi:MAG: hypothetical protein K2W95_31070 [Candidatus Obscuribacterales bacterium]|nr:hypothetical protein [Candidatus Obscuribacterales bacterium]